MNAEEAQDAQIVFRDPLRGLTDEAHAAVRKIRKAAGVVVDRAIRRDGQRVDREVAPSASRDQSRPNATFALRPKVSTSSRSVVTS